MAASESDSSSYDTGTDSENDSNPDEEHRHSVNVWDLPNDKNTINRSNILQNVHQSHSTGYIQQKQQHKSNVFQYTNPPQNNINKYANTPPPPPPQYQSNNLYQPNMNNYKMKQVQQQSRSVQYLQSSPKKAYPIQASQTMPTQQQIAYVQHANSQTNLYEQQFNGYNNQQKYIANNMQKQQNKNNVFMPPSPQNNMEEQKFRDWKNGRKIMDDKKVNDKQQKWLNSSCQNQKGSKNLKSKNGRNQHNDYMQGTIKEGYMQKEGKIVKSWKRRWFILRINGKMSYYENHNAKKELSTLDCNGITRITKESWGSNKKFGLKLITPQRKWKFVCSNNTERLEWYQAFQGIMTIRK